MRSKVDLRFVLVVFGIVVIVVGLISARFSYKAGYETAKSKYEISQEVVNIGQPYSGEILFYDPSNGRLFQPRHELKKIGGGRFIVEYDELHKLAKMRLLPDLS